MKLTKQQKKEARELIESFFDGMSRERQDELYESLLDQDYKDWEDWCANMVLDYEATDMMNNILN